MPREMCFRKINERIEDSKPGTVFVTSDFSDLATTYAANGALRRLEKSGDIRQIMRGIYERPKYSELLKEEVAPSADSVAQAIARNYGWTIVPSGLTALNMLGLSTQVPATWEYVSDGSYKTYSYGNVTLKFKKASNKEISNLSYKTALVIRALKAIGRGNVTEDDIKEIRSRLTADEKKTALEEARHTTSWIYDEIKRICK